MNSHVTPPEGACAAFAYAISLLDDPELDAARASAARDHLRGCAACRTLRQQYAALDQGLRRQFGPAAIPPRSTEEIMRFIKDRSEPATPAPPAPAHPARIPARGVRGLLPSLAAVATFVVVIGISALLIGPRLGFGPGANAGPPRYSFAGTTGSLAGISMVSPDEGWALGQVLKSDGKAQPLTEVTFYHLQNHAWSTVTIPTTTNFGDGGVSGFNGAISMDSPTDGWAVASNFNRFYALFHYTSGAWHEVPGPQLVTIQALGPRSVWGVSGEYGASNVGVQHFDGASWSFQALPPPANGFEGSAFVAALRMISDREGWALVDNAVQSGDHTHTVSAVYHFVDGAWKAHSTLDGGASASFGDLAMISPSEGWATGAKVAADAHGNTAHAPIKSLLYHYANERWSEWPLALNGLPYAVLYHITMVSATEGWIVGTEQSAYFGATTDNFQQHSVLLHYSGGAWAPVTTPTVGTPVVAITGLSFTADGTGWASGYNSNIPASQRVQDMDILAQASPMLWRYQNGAWTLYQQVEAHSAHP
jgi:hypothetical protein